MFPSDHSTALDASSSLPLFNSSTQRTYLTSTSPRIREIMPQVALSRLSRFSTNFAFVHRLPENPALFYGLAPPDAAHSLYTFPFSSCSFHVLSLCFFLLWVVLLGKTTSSPSAKRLQASARAYTLSSPSSLSLGGSRLPSSKYL
ncbi:hypothetical protein BDZ89DRAFT_974566 [Hymenopellis radicata]|nr:hypothetical protein BDZ89DRAFT_974566 [Hymenopellis radicata]